MGLRQLPESPRARQVRRGSIDQDEAARRWIAAAQVTCDRAIEEARAVLTDDAELDAASAAIDAAIRSVYRRLNVRRRGAR